MAQQSRSTVMLTNEMKSYDLWDHGCRVSMVLSVGRCCIWDHNEFPIIDLVDPTDPSISLSLFSLMMPLLEDKIVLKAQ